jgi:Arc/MetJ-type ribon-helix-helix transcriptional regulator
MPKRHTPEKTENADRIAVRLPKRYLRMLDFLVELDDFPTRSEAIRAAVRDLVYARLELVQDKAKQMQDAETALANLESLRKNYFHK